MSDCITPPPGLARISVLGGADITALPVDAICNSTGRAMHGCGGGVDGAIHRAAGPKLAAACRAIAPCGLGEARITPGFRLQAEMVVHTSVPKWLGGERGELEALASCYRTALQLADRYGARSVAFPALGCGVRGFPLATAAKVGIQTILQTLQICTSVGRVIFVCRERDTAEAFARALNDAPGDSIHSDWLSRKPAAV
jgi:O-acetyl-ADP-ribose deacetylase (regulator of RNase III)